MKEEESCPECDGTKIMVCPDCNGEFEDIYEHDECGCCFSNGTIECLYCKKK